MNLTLEILKAIPAADAHPSWFRTVTVGQLQNKFALIPMHVVDAVTTVLYDLNLITAIAGWNGAPWNRQCQLTEAGKKLLAELIEKEKLCVPS